jgi:hypothetical protein
MTQQCQQLLRSVNNDSAVSTMTTQCKQWLRSVNNDYAVSTMTTQCQQRLRSVNNSAVSTMTPQCQQWLRSVNNDSAMPQWLLTLKILWNLTQSLLILLPKKLYILELCKTQARDPFRSARSQAHLISQGNLTYISSPFLSFLCAIPSSE